MAVPRVCSEDKDLNMNYIEDENIYILYYFCSVFLFAYFCWLIKVP